MREKKTSKHLYIFVCVFVCVFAPTVGDFPARRQTNILRSHYFEHVYWRMLYPCERVWMAHLFNENIGSQMLTNKHTRKHTRAKQQQQAKTRSLFYQKLWG